MSVELSEEQRNAIRSQPDVPLQVTDSSTNASYVLVPSELYERIKSLLEDQADDISDSYAAQTESALRAGWGDPEMDDYNEYDSHRNQP